MVELPKKAGDVEFDCQFDDAFALLGDLFDPSEADKCFPVRGNAVYSSCVVLWMLVYQRMHPDKSLEAAVKHLVDSRPSFLPENKRVKQKTLSSNTSSFSDARKRLPREAAEWFSGRISQSMIEASPPTLQGRRVFLIDGTTMKLAPERELQKAFPPALNQHGPGVWPVALVAYNLVVQFRRQAAEMAKRTPRQMSFKRTWTTFRIFLLKAMYTDPASWREKYQVALRYAMKDKLPNRPAGRKYEREAYPHRPKADQFKKRRPPTATTETEN